jgi:hypothetical protein
MRIVPVDESHLPVLQEWFKRDMPYLAVDSWEKHPVFLLVLKGEKPVGYLEAWVDWLNRKAEVAIAFPEPAGKNLVVFASVNSIRWIFAQGVQRLYARPVEVNLPSIRLLEHLGFKLEGRERRAAFKDGRFMDTLTYGLLKEDFRYGGIDDAELFLPDAKPATDG